MVSKEVIAALADAGFWSETRYASQTTSAVMQSVFFAKLDFINL